jgi:iron complex transport system ATP-binding protein
LNFPFTVAEVVALGRIPHTTGKQRDREITAEAMAATDVLTMRDRLYTQLSGGEKQRVQLARIFAQVWTAAEQDHRLLLLDEPTAALDMGHQHLLTGLLRTLAGRGCSIVLVLHDFNILASVADTVSALHEGRFISQGRPADIFTSQLFKQVFDSEVEIMQHPKHHYPLVVQS